LWRKTNFNVNFNRSTLTLTLRRKKSKSNALEKINAIQRIWILYTHTHTTPITAACTLKGAKKGGDGEKVKLMSDMQEFFTRN
jgi:hypothetical protein